MTLKEEFKKIKYILKGIATIMPNSIARYLPAHQGQFTGRGVRKIYGGKQEVARACYTTWMRTLIRSEECGHPLPLEQIWHVAEIGPGDSLGVGFAALISGAQKYSALDVVPTALNYENEEILEEIIDLFKKREPIPGDSEHPKAFPRLKSYEFPRHIFPEEKLQFLLKEERLQDIREALKSFLKKIPKDVQNEVCISYFAPWGDRATTQILHEDVDLIVSYAAMEHVEDIGRMYDACSLILKKGGHMAHVIDFKSHDTAGYWNGHWTYSNLVWKMICGKSKYLINREPHSAHLAAIAKRFNIFCDDKYAKKSFVKRPDLAKKFLRITDDDLVTSGVFIVAQKL